MVDWQLFGMYYTLSFPSIVFSHISFTTVSTHGIPLQFFQLFRSQILHHTSQTQPRYRTVSLTVFRCESASVCYCDHACRAKLQVVHLVPPFKRFCLPQTDRTPSGAQEFGVLINGSNIFFPIEPPLRICGVLPPAALRNHVVVAKLT